MRPEKLNRLIQKGINESLYKDSPGRLKYLLLNMQKLLFKYIAREELYAPGAVDWEDCISNDDFDWSSEESVRNTLYHYSDRWRCAHRLSWIIDAVKLDKI